MAHAEIEQSAAELLPSGEELHHELNLDRDIFQEDDEGVKVSTVLLIVLFVPVAAYGIYLLLGTLAH